MGRLGKALACQENEETPTKSSPSSSQSPKWNKPNDIIRLRLQKRRKSRKTPSASHQRQVLQVVDTNVQEDSHGDPGSHSFPGDQLESHEMKVKQSDQQPSLFDAIDHFQQEKKFNMAADHAIENAIPSRHFNDMQELSKLNFGTSLPVDWSLKLSCRFICQTPLQWCNNITSNDEIMAVTNFVRCCNQSELNNQPDNLGTLLKQYLLTWCHPVLPGIELFPRTGRKPSKLSQAGPIVTNEQMLKAMMSNWKESFYSIYHMTRCQKCPYFYLCTHQFSILFIAEGINGSPSITAIVSSTTSGFRQLLSNEGIQFHAVGRKGNEQEATDEYKDNFVVSDDEFDVNSDSDSLTGNAEDDESHLDCHNVNDINDRQKASALRIEGSSHVHAFYNFLLNYKNLVAPIGWQAGIPPTILSPVAFCGGTLKPLTFKCNKMKQPNILGKTEEKSYLEISGPVIPCQFIRICNLLRSAHGNNMKASIKCLESTSVFNTSGHSMLDDSNSNHLPDEVMPVAKLQNYNLSEVMLKQLASKNSLDGKSIKSVQLINGNFHWSTA
ncbi:uncharacterized protein TRIADDRAFT_56951 [Trichoplax adhaerens]|uniref:Protein downstream neighbor of Son n=1 Tax=Trichoplax adhaerens TaxID=10228 RepID=B3RX07_TRIAD|nr:hypothetical protein TRIADDRAFT_56951 [Trichoplax adhaerens]EDV24786.1 hypothetical protein TRIADDRAFT_56951 [Trichoplax adhaerens]|eukprot:XP_002112676.1 hypothetical protein TRIADDRAFT_56951 [Trichoplax adhaerens]